MFQTPVPPTQSTQSTQSPLARFGLFRTSDLDEARSRVTQVFCDHRLEVVGRRKHVEASMHYRSVGALGIGRMSYGASVMIDPGCLQTFYLIQIVRKGAEGVRTMGETVHSTHAVASVVSPSEAVTMLHHDGCEKLFVRVERAALERHCAGQLGRPLREPVVFAPRMAVDESRAAAWLRWVGWLFAELSDDRAEGSPWVDSPLLAAQIEQAGIAALLHCQPHSHQEAMRALDQDAHRLSPGFVRRAAAYLEEHADAPLSIADVAAHVGVSTRALFRGFRKYRDTTPMKYLATVRMERVREELLQGHVMGETIGDVARRWGFCHLGHFSARYRQQFGELPSRTLKR
ncbi:AraC family transcriptional regulator [soil metagenome]